MKRTNLLLSTLFCTLLVGSLFLACKKKTSADGTVKLGYKGEQSAGSTTSTSTTGTTTNATTGSTTSPSTTTTTGASNATLSGQLFIQGVGKGLALTSASGSPLIVDALVAGGTESVTIKFGPNISPATIPPPGSYTVVAASPANTNFTLTYTYVSGGVTWNFTAPTPSPSKRLDLTYPNGKQVIVILASTPITVSNPTTTKVPAPVPPFTSRTIYGKINIL